VSYFDSRRILVTGGASFIGSHLVKALVRSGARVSVVDDLSSGTVENLSEVLPEIDLVTGDLKDPEFARETSRGKEVVFHLAADHGGRGYVDLHQYACATNMALDQNVFRACLKEGIEKVVYASSGCVYPNHLQGNPQEILYLTEDGVGPPYDPDGMYGMAKLSGELTLQALYGEHGLPSVSLRYFTVYGPQGVENHAVMAMIARAFIGEDPFVVWGTGEQIRNWTYVEDIVSGTLAAAEKAHSAAAFNLGTMERVRVVDAVKMVLEYTGHDGQIEFRPEMPTGPLNRVADNSLAKGLLGWEPRVGFAEGLKRTIDWYFAAKERDEVRAYLSTILTERPTALSASTSKL